METVSEYISKTEMLIRLKCLAPKADDWNNYDEYNVAVSQYDYMCDYLKSIEPADVAPVVHHGRWTNYYFHPCGNRGHCSVCGKDSRQTNYCPNCGAKMDEDVK